MDLPQSLEHSSGLKCEADDGYTIPQLKTSRDVQQLAYNYFTGEDESARHGPHCHSCMNHMFRDGKLNGISMVFIFTTTGFIPFPIRALVFMNGMDVPFSMKNIDEDFLLSPCFNCAQNSNTLNTIPATGAGDSPVIRTSPRRKRRLSNQNLPEITTSLIGVKQEPASSQNSMERMDVVDEQAASRIDPIINNQVFEVPSNSVASSTDGEVPTVVENIAVEANSTLPLLPNEVLEEGTSEGTATELSTIVVPTLPRSKSIAVRIRDDHGKNELLEEDLLDLRVLQDARDSLKTKGYINTYLLLPFFAGKVHDDPGLSFQQLFDGIEFLKSCGMTETRQGYSFGAYMCELFPEIINIRRCMFCETTLTPDPSGATYISHFLSLDHIVQAMNMGERGFSRDLISLKKCLTGFFSKIGNEGYVARLHGPQMSRYILERQFSSRSEEFPLWVDRLKK